MYNNLGTAYYLKKDYDKAVASYQKAIEIDPGYAAAHNNLAVFYQAAGAYDLAIKQADQALALGYEVPASAPGPLQEEMTKL